jgi:hypothetical protein
VLGVALGAEDADDELLPAAVVGGVLEPHAVASGIDAARATVTSSRRTRGV